MVVIVDIQSLSHVQLFATPGTAALQAPLSSIISCSLLKFMSIEPVMLSNHLILCCPLLLNLSQHQGLFQWVDSASDDQTIGASTSASVLPMNIQGWFPLGLSGMNSLLSKGLSRVFSSTTVQKHQFFSAQPSLWSNSLHKYRLLFFELSTFIASIIKKWNKWKNTFNVDFSFDHRLNLSPQQWKLRVLTTGLPGNSLKSL